MKVRPINDPWWLAVWDRDVAPVLELPLSPAQLSRAVRKATRLFYFDTIAVNAIAAAEGERIVFNDATKLWEERCKDD